MHSPIQASRNHHQPSNSTHDLPIFPRPHYPRKLERQKHPRPARQTPSAGQAGVSLLMSRVVPTFGDGHPPDSRPLLDHLLQPHARQAGQIDSHVARSLKHGNVDFPYQSFRYGAYCYRHCAFAVATFCICHGVTVARVLHVMRGLNVSLLLRVQQVWHVSCSSGFLAPLNSHA